METNYKGSQLFAFLSNSSGLPLDQLNFLIAQLSAIIIGLLFRSYLKPCPSNTLKRHLVTILIGILLGHFCFGRQMWHVFTQTFISYVALVFCPRQYVHLVIFVFTMGYLSALHIYRLIYDYANYTLDVTGLMMITTQKLTSFAFSYYDGMRPMEKLTDDQKSQAISQAPHIIEFLSYIFNFQGIIVGPLVYYRDYIDFIDGNNILKQKNKNSNDLEVSTIMVQPSVRMALLKKLIGVVVLAIIFFKVTLVYPIRAHLSPELLNTPFWYRFFHYNISSGSQRIKYYLAWVLADAVNNASGLGFNGYDISGNPKWDLVTNVNIFKEETSTCMKEVFENWNIQTQLWLKRIGYDRLPTGKTLGVFVLSAFWHGFYPGYYITFVLCACFVYSGRGVRRTIRPYFQQNHFTKVFYDIVTWFLTMTSVNYAAASFDLLGFWVSVEFYNTWYWVIHIVAFLLAIILPGGSKKTKKSTDPVKNPSGNNENKEKEN